MNNLKTRTWGSELEINTDIRAVIYSEEMTWKAGRMSRIKRVWQTIPSPLGLCDVFAENSPHWEQTETWRSNSEFIPSCLLGLPQNWIGKLYWKTLWCFSSCAISFRKNNEQGRIFSFMDTGIQGSGGELQFPSCPVAGSSVTLGRSLTFQTPEWPPVCLERSRS